MPDQAAVGVRDMKINSLKYAVPFQFDDYRVKMFVISTDTIRSMAKYLELLYPDLNQEEFSIILSELSAMKKDINESVTVNEEFFGNCDDNELIQ